MKKASVIMIVCLMILVAGCGGGTGTNTKVDTSTTQNKFPTKPITLVAHSGPGSGADIFTRQAGKALQNVLGNTVVVENRSGGSGAVSLQNVSEAKPDGYTLLSITNTHLITPLTNSVPKDMSYLKPVSRLVLDGNVLYVKADSKWNADNMIEAMTKGKENIKWASPVAGSPESIAIETLVKKYKMKINPVQYSDGAKCLVGVLNGDVEASIAEMAEILPQLEAKKVKVIMVFNSSRIPSLPDAPTFVEKGYSEVFVDKFRGFAVPKDTPSEIVKILEEAFKKVMEDPDYKKAYERSNQISAYLGSADFQKFTNETEEKYKKAFGK